VLLGVRVALLLYTEIRITMQLEAMIKRALSSIARNANPTQPRNVALDDEEQEGETRFVKFVW